MEKANQTPQEGTIATYRVTTLDDELDSTSIDDLLADLNDLSSREALFIANNRSGSDSITFATTGTITLTRGPLEIASDVIINGDVDGDGRGDLTIDADNLSRVLRVSAGASTINGLTLTGANSSGLTGGVLIVNADLTLTNAAVSGNKTNASGGGIANVSLSPLTVSNSTVTGNKAGIRGGGIYNNNTNPTTAVLSNTLVMGNAAFEDVEVGGSYVNQGGNLIGVADAADVFAAIDSTTQGGQLADNGGPVQTVVLKADVDNLALNGGDKTLLPEDAQDLDHDGDVSEDLPLDAAVNARVDGIEVDIGAFGYQNSAPVITGDGGRATAAISITENTATVTDVEASDDRDAEKAGLTYELTGADAALFDFDATTGVLTFKNAPHFENPLDQGGDNFPWIGPWHRSWEGTPERRP